MTFREWLIRKLGGVPSETCDNIYKYAKDEMEYVWPESDDMQDEMKKCILDIVSVFSAQGHSGFSASYLLGVAPKLMSFEPLSPLTGEDNEWCWLDYCDDMKAQNKRCSHVFMRADGTAYDSEGRVFREPDGSCYTSGESRVDITFPYTPTREYIDVPYSEEE